MANGVKLATNIRATRPKGTAGLDRVSTSTIGFCEAVDGDRLSLTLPLSEQLVEERIVLGIRNAEAPAFFPQQELLSTGEESVSKVEFEGATVSIAVRDGVDNGVTGHLIGSVLYHVAEHQRFVVTQQSFVKVGLDGAGDFLKGVFRVSTLYFFEMTTRSP